LFRVLVGDISIAAAEQREEEEEEAAAAAAEGRREPEAELQVAFAAGHEERFEDGGTLHGGSFGGTYTLRRAAGVEHVAISYEGELREDGTEEGERDGGRVAGRGDGRSADEQQQQQHHEHQQYSLMTEDQAGRLRAGEQEAATTTRPSHRSGSNGSSPLRAVKHVSFRDPEVE